MKIAITISASSWLKPPVRRSLMSAGQVHGFEVGDRVLIRDAFGFKGMFGTVVEEMRHSGPPTILRVHIEGFRGGPFYFHFHPFQLVKAASQEIVDEFVRASD
jgi:hypothetical protein